MPTHHVEIWFANNEPLILTLTDDTYNKLINVVNRSDTVTSFTLTSAGITHTIYPKTICRILEKPIDGEIL